MAWEGLKPGDSRLYADSMLAYDRLESLLHGLFRRWSEVGSERYRPEEPGAHEMTVNLYAGDRRLESIWAIVGFYGSGEDSTTSLQMAWMARKREASRLSTEVATRGLFKISGALRAKPSEGEWFVRSLDLGGLEGSPREEQWNAVTAFLKETIQVVEDSDLLESV